MVVVKCQLVCWFVCGADEPTTMGQSLRSQGSGISMLSDFCIFTHFFISSDFRIFGCL